MIFLNQQTKAISQFEFLDGMFRNRLDLKGIFGRGAGWQQRVKRAVFAGEVFAGDTLQVRGSDAFDGGEITFRKIEIVGGEPTAAEILCLALHGLSCRQGAGEELL